MPVPRGYEIDEGRSSYNRIVFKPINKTYDDIAANLFAGNVRYYQNDGEIYSDASNTSSFKLPGNACSELQVRKLIAINKLMNVAKYLNGDWQLDFDNLRQRKFWIVNISNTVSVVISRDINYGTVCFRGEQLAYRAINILGEDVIRLALS